MPLSEEEFAGVQLPKERSLSTGMLTVPGTEDVPATPTDVLATPTEDGYEVAEEVHVPPLPTAPIDPSMTLPPFGKTP